MDSIAIKNSNFYIFIIEIIKEIFKVSLFTIILFYFINVLGNEIISDYFNLNILLIITIISGIITVAFKKDHDNEIIPQFKKRDYFFIILFGVASLLIIHYQIKDIGKLAYLISVITGVIIVLISILLLKDSHQSEESQ